MQAKIAFSILILCAMLFAESDDMFEFKKFIVIPGGAYTEETGVILLVGAQIFVVPPAEDGSSAGVSNSIMAMSSFEKHVQFVNKFDYESPSALWNLESYLYLCYWPTRFYGKGNDLDEDKYVTYTSRNIRLPITFGTNLFLPKSWKSRFNYGLEFDAEYITFDKDHITFNSEKFNLKDESRFGVGYNLTYNSAEKNDWPRKGSFVQARHITFGSFIWKNLDTRMYIPLPVLPEGVLALSSYLEDFDGKVPIDRLAQPDGVGQMRGLKKGLLADKTSWVLQSELRTHLFWRCKGTLFYEAAKVGDGFKELHNNEWHESIGIGGRFMVNSKSKTHIRADFAVINRESFGMAIKINEAF